MTIETFTSLLAVFAILTSLITEGVKNVLASFNKKYPANIIVLCVSVLVGGVGTCLFYVWSDYTWTIKNIIWIFLMTGANWLGSMVGYDKVIQTITQIKVAKKEPESEKG